MGLVDRQRLPRLAECSPATESRLRDDGIDFGHVCNGKTGGRKKPVPRRVRLLRRINSRLRLIGHFSKRKQACCSTSGRMLSSSFVRVVRWGSSVVFVRGSGSSKSFVKTKEPTRSTRMLEVGKDNPMTDNAKPATPSSPPAAGYHSERALSCLTGVYKPSK